MVDETCVQAHDDTCAEAPIVATEDGGRGTNACEEEEGRSHFRGVAIHRWTGRFEAHIWEQGKQVYLGSFDTEEKAARAYDKAAISFKRNTDILNFPIEDYEQERPYLEQVTKEELITELRRTSAGFSRGTCHYRGVSWRPTTGRWEARIGRLLGRKYTYLGTFKSGEEAARAYDRAAIVCRGRNAITNFDLQDYEEEIREVEAATPEQREAMEKQIASRSMNAGAIQRKRSLPQGANNCCRDAKRAGSSEACSSMHDSDQPCTTFPQSQRGRNPLQSSEAEFQRNLSPSTDTHVRGQDHMDFSQLESGMQHIATNSESNFSLLEELLEGHLGRGEEDAIQKPRHQEGEFFTSYPTPAACAEVVSPNRRRSRGTFASMMSDSNPLQELGTRHWSQGYQEPFMHPSNHHTSRPYSTRSRGGISSLGKQVLMGSPIIAPNGSLKLGNMARNNEQERADCAGMDVSRRIDNVCLSNEEQCSWPFHSPAHRRYASQYRGAARPPMTLDMSSASKN